MGFRKTFDLIPESFDRYRPRFYDGIKEAIRNAGGVITKEDCAELIRGVQEELDKTEPGSSEYNYQKQRLEEYTECCSALYKVAPSAADVQPIKPVLGTYQQGFSYEKGKDAVANCISGLDVRASVAGEEWQLAAYVGNEIYGNCIYAKRDTDLWSDNEQPLDAPYGVQMTKSEAMQKAAKIAETLTNGELAPCCCAPMYFHTNKGDDLSRRWSQWRVVLMRTFNGVGTAYAEEDIGSAMESTVTKTVAYEKMTIDLDDHGVTAITWRTPMKVTGIVQSDAQLISFEEAAGKAMKHIAARWKYDAENDRENGVSLTVCLRRVTFGLWRIAKKNGGWYYVPVYHFFSEAHEGSWATSEGFWGEGTPRERFLNNLKRLESGAQDTSFSLSNDCLTFGAEYWGGVTVNALDGTIIDKDKGY